MPKTKDTGFYGVHRGRRPGVYTTWAECEAQIKGFKGARQKKFKTAEEARHFMETGHTLVETPPTSGPNPTRGEGSRHHPYPQEKPQTPRPPNEVTQPMASSQYTVGATMRSNRKIGGVPSVLGPKTGRLGQTDSKSDPDNRSQAFHSQSLQPKKGSADESDADIVYTDGACRSNGKAGATAGIGVWWGPNDPRNISERCPGVQTNNRAELIAIVRTLETYPLEVHEEGNTGELDNSRENQKQRKLVIRTDSRYSISCLSTWVSEWERTGWQSKKGGEVKNKALIQYILSLLHLREVYGCIVKFEHVRGHSGDRGNDAADALAVHGAVSHPPVEDRDWDAERDQVEEVIMLRMSEMQMQKKTKETEISGKEKEMPQEAINVEDKPVKEDEEKEVPVNWKSQIEFVISEEDLLNVEELESMEKRQEFG